MDCSTRKGRSEGSKNRDKKIVIVKLKIINKRRRKSKKEKKKTTSTTKSVISLAKVPLATNAGIVAYEWRFLDAAVSSQGWYSGLCGKGCCPSCQTAWRRGGWRSFFLFFDCLGLMGHPLQVGAVKWFHQMVGL
jgi:hypothetical protein